MVKTTFALAVPVNVIWELFPKQGARFAVTVAVGNGTTVAIEVPETGCGQGVAPGKLTLTKEYVALAVSTPVEMIAFPAPLKVNDCATPPFTV